MGNTVHRRCRRVDDYITLLAGPGSIFARIAENCFEGRLPIASMRFAMRHAGSLSATAALLEGLLGAAAGSVRNGNDAPGSFWRWSPGF